MTLKVMLVGGYGFIGRRFIKKYHNKYRLIIFGKRSSYQKFIKKNSYSNTVYEIGDVTNNVTTAISIHKPDVVIHMAALTGIKKCEQNSQKAFSINVFGTYNVIKGCIINNSKLIYISSREVYGDTKNKKATENTPIFPQNVYGVTKLLGEKLIKFAKINSGLCFTILRLTNVYGPEGDNYAIQKIIKDAKKGKITVYGGDQKLNFVYVDDVVKILANTIENKRTNNEIFNLGSNDDLLLNEIIKIILRQLKKDVKVYYKPMRKGDVLNFSPNIKKLQSYLRINRFKNIKSGIRETICWYSN